MNRSVPGAQRHNKLLRRAVDWWESDRSRLILIRIVWYLLFAASVSGTVYAAWKGALPAWALTLYAFFVVQLVFMTFMYAIKHSGLQELRGALFALRRQRLVQWEFERAMLAEFVRFAACTSAGINPTPAVSKPNRRRLVRSKPPLPAVENRSEETRRLIRQAVQARATHPDAAGTAEPSRKEPIVIKFLAYSAETLIGLSRDIVAQLDDTLSEECRLEEDLEVRVLIRDISGDHDWLVPLAVNEREDAEYAEDLRVRFRNVQRSALKEFEDGLRDVLPPRQVKFDVRGYRLEPLLKGLVVDDREGMVGLYAIDDLRNPTGWDYSGHAVDLCRVTAGGSYFENTGLQMYNDWFDKVWEDDHLSRNVNHR